MTTGIRPPHSACRTFRFAATPAFIAAPALAPGGGSTITMMHGFHARRECRGASDRRPSRQAAKSPGWCRAGREQAAPPGRRGARSAPPRSPSAGGRAVSAAIYKQLPYNAIEQLLLLAVPDRLPLHSRDLSGSPGEKRRRRDQVGAGRSRQTHLRHCRQRYRHASRVRALRRDGQGENPAHSLSRLAAGHHRSSGEARRLSGRYAGCLDAVHLGRTSARDRRHRAEGIFQCCRGCRRWRPVVCRVIR